MQQNLLDIFNPPGVGPFGLIAPLAPAVVAPQFEGLWTPIVGAKAATLELSGSMDTLGVDVYGTNDPNAADNGYTLTVGGTITNGDTITATFKNPNLPGTGSVAVVVPVVTADTTTTLAAKLAAAINANAVLAALAIVAAAAVAVVTVTFPSVAPGPGAAGTGTFANLTTVSTAITGGATETLTVAVLTNGIKLGTTLAAFGLTAIAVLPAFIKIRVTTLTGANAVVHANLAASF